MRKPARRYQLLNDQGYCLEPGCPWRVFGDPAEAAAEAHTNSTGHETQVLTGAKVIFTRPRAAQEVAARA